MESTYVSNGIFDELTSITATVFDTMLGQTVGILEEGCEPVRPDVTACITLAGGWNGTLTLECGHDQARSFAAAMLGSAPEELETPDIADAIGELANIVAGNLKALLPAARLGLPSVVLGSNYEVQVCRAKPLRRITLTSPWGPFRIGLFEEERA